MPIKTVIFDINGVVVDSTMFSAQLEKDHGIPRSLLIPFFHGIFQKCLIGEADLREEILPYYRYWGWKGTLDELLLYWFRVEGAIDKRIIKLIKRLKQSGKFCCAATNQEKYRTEYLKKEMGLKNIFNLFFSSADLACKKPEAIFYEKVFASINGKLSVKKEEIFFIDDDEKNIEGAANFGFQTFLYQDFEIFDRTIKDKILNKK